MFKSLLRSSEKPSKRGIVLIAAVVVVGLVVVAVTRAAGTSTISGVAFKDTNRNGVQDAGEEPMAGQGIVLTNENGQNYVASMSTDSAGRYTFSGLNDGNYTVEYNPTVWWEIRQDLVPTTTGTVFPKKTIDLSGSSDVNFGWRQIVHSDDINAPISSYEAPNGLKVRSYNDAISAQEVYGFLAQGSLIGEETPFITVNFGYREAPGSCVVNVSGSPGYYTNYKASAYVPYVSQLINPDQTLFHEYGHAWSQYFAFIKHQSRDFTEYLRLRGIENDPRLDTNHAWSRLELIAEDYRQLFGSPSAQLITQENLDLPSAKDVPGLREYLSGAFMQSTPGPAADTTAPSTPTGLSGSSVSANEIKLTWTASTDNVEVVKYYMFRNGQHVGYVNSPSTTYTDTSLTPGTSYQYYVKAVDAANNQSAQSTTITVKAQATDTQSPTAPTSLTSPSQTNSSISLKWNLSTDNVGVVGYRIYQVGGRKNSYSTQVGTSTNPAFAVGNLSPNKSYTFYVVAVDAAGNVSSPSNTLSAKTRR